MVKKIEVNGKFYKRTKPKEDGFCFGCVGYTTGGPCTALPPCYENDKNYIFVEVKVKETLSHD